MKLSACAFFVLLTFFLILVGVPTLTAVHTEPNTVVVPDDYLTITDAVGNVSEGGVVFVKSGIYPEIVVINKSLSLIGENPLTTIINGNNKGPVVYLCKPDVTVANFTILNGDTPAEPSPYFPYSTRLAGIHIMANNCNVLNNTIMNSGCGIWVYNSNNAQIIGNNILNNSNGINLELSSNNNFECNYVTNSWDGIGFKHSSNNVLRNNTFYNVVQSLWVDGNQLSHFVNDVDTSNSVDKKPFQYLVNKNDLVLDPSVVPELDFIVLVNCTNITLQNFQLTQEHNSIHLAYTNYSRIIQNTVNSAINLDFSSYNTIINNAASVFLENSTYNEIKNNTGAVRLQYSSLYNTVTENTITGVEQGISLGFSSCNNYIQGNEITSNSAGLLFYSGCNNNTIIGNNISKNGRSGIWVEATFPLTSDFNKIIGNNFTENAGSGILLRSSYGNMICGNIFAGNQGGLALGGDNSQNCTVVGNTFVNNDEGINLLSQYSSTFYHNNFINNTRQAVCSSVKCAVNTWDNGYPSGGNYWDNYVGQDTDHDGIGDTSHTAYSDNKDNYPLIAPMNYFDAGTWEWTQYTVELVSNSLIFNFSFNPQSALIQFNLEQNTNTTGFCRIGIPQNLLTTENNWNVQLNNTPTASTVNEYANVSYLYFDYPSDTKTVKIIGTNAIPEFPLGIVLPIFLFSFLVLSLCKWKLSKTASN